MSRAMRNVFYYYYCRLSFVINGQLLAEEECQQMNKKKKKMSRRRKILYLACKLLSTCFEIQCKACSIHDLHSKYIISGPITYLPNFVKLISIKSGAFCEREKHTACDDRQLHLSTSNFTPDKSHFSLPLPPPPHDSRMGV